MLDRLFRRLGYVPISAISLVPSGAGLTANRALHQVHAEGFDRSAARTDALCSWHDDGDGFHLAVGRDDWVPLAAAGFCLVDNDECMAWLDHSIRARTWVPYDILTSWHAANRCVLHGFGYRLTEWDKLRAPARITTTSEQEVAPLVAANEIAELFAVAWRRHHLASPFRRLGDSAPYQILGRHHTLRLVDQTTEHALERVVEWLALWLEARGLKIDRTEQAVYLPGYQALYYR